MIKKRHKKAHKKVHKLVNKEELNPVRVGLALAIVCTLYIFFLGVVAGLFGWGRALVRVFSSLYLGYDVTLEGLLIGMFWTFIDCFIAGYLFAWIYNKIGAYNI